MALSNAVFGIVLVSMLAIPASAQVATKGDVDILERKIMDLDFRLRALEREKEDKRQAEQRAEAERQNDAQMESWRNCQAYRRRIANAPPSNQAMLGDEFDKMNCKRADKFEADNAAKVRALDQRKQ